jgi:hypothetical protein
MLAVVSVVDHTKLTPPLAVNVVLWPWHKVAVPVMFAVGKELTVKVRLAVAEQPLALVAVTV